MSKILYFKLNFVCQKFYFLFASQEYDFTKQDFRGRVGLVTRVPQILTF
jgi:hypothetical protein